MKIFESGFTIVNRVEYCWIIRKLNRIRQTTELPVLIKRHKAKLIIYYNAFYLLIKTYVLS